MARAGRGGAGHGTGRSRVILGRRVVWCGIPWHHEVQPAAEDRGLSSVTFVRGCDQIGALQQCKCIKGPGYGVDQAMAAPLEGLQERIKQYPGLTMARVTKWAGVKDRTFYGWMRGQLPDNAEALLRLQAFAEGRVEPRRLGKGWFFQEVTEGDVRVRLARLLQGLSTFVEDVKEITWSTGEAPGDLTDSDMHVNHRRMLTDAIRREGHDTKPLTRPKNVLTKFETDDVEWLDEQAARNRCSRSEVIRAAIAVVRAKEAEEGEKE